MMKEEKSNKVPIPLIESMVQWSTTDKACEILHEVDFTTEKDMFKAIASIQNYIEQVETTIHSLQDRLAKSFTKEEVIDLIIKERKRAVDIAHSFWKSNDKIYQDKKNAGHGLAFISEEIANECRLVGNAISGLNALSITLGETIESTITQELSDLPPHRNTN